MQQWTSRRRIYLLWPLSHSACDAENYLCVMLMTNEAGKRSRWRHVWSWLKHIRLDGIAFCWLTLKFPMKEFCRHIAQLNCRSILFRNWSIRICIFSNFIYSNFNEKKIWYVYIQRRRPQHQRENIIKNVHRKQGIKSLVSRVEKNIGNNMGTNILLRISKKNHMCKKWTEKQKNKWWMGFLLSKMRKTTNCL